MQQRLCLAHALVHDPAVLLLDEPASGLDPRARVELRELLRELRSLGKTILISSHILPELEELCTSVAIVDRGQVLAQGAGRGHRAAAPLRRGPPGPRARPRARRSRPPGPTSRPTSTSRRPTCSTTARSRSGSGATTPPRPGSCREAVSAGLPIVTFARAASDLEELFLQVTAPAESAPIERAGSAA